MFKLKDKAKDNLFLKPSNGASQALGVECKQHFELDVFVFMSTTLCRGQTRGHQPSVTSTSISRTRRIKFTDFLFPLSSAGPAVK